MTPTTMAARATATAIPRTITNRSFALVLAIAALAAAGCGGGAKPSSQTAAAFAWLHPASAPSGWSRVAIPTGAAYYVPPGWRAVHSDRGTASAALLDANGRYRGYLNLTPRQSTESLANWARFRVDHNREENESHDVAQAAARGLQFRDGAHGSCVRDAYTSGSGVRYVEIACLVAGHRISTVIVGAAQSDAWAQLEPVLQRAVSAVQS
jgi:hypothetical protein